MKRHGGLPWVRGSQRQSHRNGNIPRPTLGSPRSTAITSERRYPATDPGFAAVNREHIGTAIHGGLPWVRGSQRQSHRNGNIPRPTLGSPRSTAITPERQYTAAYPGFAAVNGNHIGTAISRDRSWVRRGQPRSHRNGDIPRPTLGSPRSTASTSERQYTAAYPGFAAVNGNHIGTAISRDRPWVRRGQRRSHRNGNTRQPTLGSRQSTAITSERQYPATDPGFAAVNRNHIGTAIHGGRPWVRRGQPRSHRNGNTRRPTLGSPRSTAITSERQYTATYPEPLHGSVSPHRLVRQRFISRPPVIK